MTGRFSLARALGLIGISGLLSGGIAQPVTAQTPQPIGPQTLANLTLAGDQDEAVAAVDPNGNLLVIWRDEFLDGNASAIIGRRFSARTGLPVSSEFLINVTTDGDQRNPAIAVADDGRFVVVWEGPDTTGPATPGIFGSLRAANGTPIEAEFAVNVGTAGVQRRPAVAMQPGGAFLVVWQDGAPTPGLVDTGSNIAARLYPANFPSAPAGSPVLLNTSLDGEQEHPAIAARPAVAGWLAGWQGPNLDTPLSPSILARILDSNLAGGSEFVVNTTQSVGLRSHVAVAANGQGDAVVVWEAPDGNQRGIYARSFVDGVPGASEEQINLSTGADEREPSVAIDQFGAFVTAWVVASPAVTDPWSEHPEGSPIVIQGRKKNAGGSLTATGLAGAGDLVPPADAEFQINTSGNAFLDPWVALEPRGNFVIAWQGTDSEDPDGNGVFFRGFRAALFADDFETGDTARWSNTAP